MKILIVDDHGETLKAFETLLQKHRCQTVTADNEHDAFERAAVERPDVILLDVGMPRRRSGMQVCRRIRSMSWGSKPLIVGVNSWTAEEDETAALSAGFDRYLYEAVGHQTLINLIDSGRKSFVHR